MSSCFCVVKKEKARRQLHAQELASEDEARLIAQLTLRSKISPVRPAGEDPRGAIYRVVIQDFEACVEDEVAVQRGDCVRELFRDGDWTFVTTTTGQVGFIPASYCRPVSALIYPNNPRSAADRNSPSRPSFRQFSEETNVLTQGATTMDDSTLSSASSRRDLDRPPRAASAEPKLSARMQPPHYNTSPSLFFPRRESYLDALGENSFPSPIRRPLQAIPDTAAARTADLRSSTSRSALSTPFDALSVGNSRNCDSPGSTIDRTAKNFSRQNSMRFKISLDVSGWSTGTPRKVRMMYNFEPNSENEVAVSKGDEVAVLSGSDRNWLYVRTRHGCEGYIPTCLTAPIDRQGRSVSSSALTSQQPAYARPVTNGYSTDVKPTGSPGADSAYVPGDSSESDNYSTSVSQRSSIASSLSTDSMPFSPPAGFYATQRSVSAKVATAERILESPLTRTDNGEPAKCQSRGQSRNSNHVHTACDDVSAPVKTDPRPRLVVLFDYTALVRNELTVREGDVVFEIRDKGKKDWVWVGLPRTNEEGYIPQSFTHPYGTHVNEQDRLCTAI